MTNREWLNSLSNEEIAKVINQSCCRLCIGKNDGKYCYEHDCDEGIKEWLNKKHIEPMPEIKAGDYIVYKKGGSLYRAVCVYGNIVYRIDRGWCCNYGDEMQEKTISIKRYDVANGTLEDVWKAENE